MYNMERDSVLKIFKETGVLMQGHFLLASGRHSDTYLQCARIFQYPDYSEKIAMTLADYFSDDDIDLVIGPAIGAIILSYEVARCLGGKNDICRAGRWENGPEERFRDRKGQPGFGGGRCYNNRRFGKRGN